MNRFASLLDRLTQSRLWRSFFRHGWPDNPLDHSLAMTSNIFFHLHPVKANRRSLRWSYSFGLGIMSAVFFGVLVWTGVLLMFYYIPSVERAYGTMKEIRLSVPLGQFTRNIYSWVPHGIVFSMVLFSALVFTISGFLFRGPRFKLYWPWEMPEGYKTMGEVLNAARSG